MREPISMHSERHAKAILIERVTTAARRMREPPNEREAISMHSG